MQSLQERTALILKEQGIRQTDLARAAGVTKGLVGQWLNGPAKSMSYAPARRIGTKYGYAIDWLMSGQEPKMSGTNGGRHSQIHPDSMLSPEALEIARLWAELSPQAAGTVRDLIYWMRLADRRYPWLRRGRPRGENYDDWERRMEQNFLAITELEKKHGRMS